MIHNYFSKIGLTLFLGLFCIKGISQNDYSVVPIPFQAYAPGLAVDGTQDDTYSSIVSLTFNFDFFGNIYIMKFL